MILAAFRFALPRISPRFALAIRSTCKSLILHRLASLDICKIAFPMLPKGKEILHI